MLSDFLRERNLVCVDQLPPSTITHTYWCDTTGASSHIDHFVCDASLATLAVSVVPLQCGSNLSDHLPIVIITVFELGSNNFTKVTMVDYNTHNYYLCHDFISLPGA